MIKLKSTKKIIAIGLAVLSIFSFVGCGAKSASNYVTSSDGKKLFVLRMPTQTGFNEFDIADELGYFKEEGIQLKYTGLLHDTTEVQSVLTNNNDVFTNHPSSVVRARLAGAKIKIVAPGMVDNAKLVHMDYIVKEDGPIKNVQDVKNIIKTRKIKWAVSSTDTCTDIIASEWAKQNGINPKNDINFVVMPDDQQEQSVKQGIVDIGCLHPPFIKKAQNDGGTKSLFTSFDVVKGPAGGSSIRGFSEKFIKEHPEVVTGFIKAIDKAHHWINANPDKAIQIIAKRLNMKPENVNTFYYDETDYVQKEYIQTWINMMVDTGSLEKDKVKAEDLYTNALNPYHKEQ